MFRSAHHPKPHMRPRRKRKPPWTDPATLITDATATRYTIGREGARLIACGCLPPLVGRDQVAILGCLLREKEGGAQ